ncbi:MAG: hypothetical protein WC796_03180 [Candidatus Pacearchaeota archaeon]|jgi:Asp-tRNA(Asn)/Glu-tRNA(Gln) amidotransferase C subunit
MSSELLWRKLSEAEKKQVEQKAKNIMMSFGKILDKLPARKEASVERDIFERDETQPWQPNPEFKKQILKNAPETQGDCIKAEKGSWIK